MVRPRAGPAAARIRRRHEELSCQPQSACQAANDIVPVAGGRRVSRRAWELHQPFKRALIARIPQDGSTLTRADVLNWIAAHDSETGDSATVATMIVERAHVQALAETAAKSW